MKGRVRPRGDSAEKMAARLWRLFWLVILVGHGFLAAGWWWLEPGGFRVSHPRFWSNRIAPVLGLGLSIASLAGLRVGSAKALRWFLPIWPAAWGGAAIAGRALFPITLSELWLIPLAGSATMGLAVVAPWRAPGSRSWGGALVLALCAAWAGAALVWTQRPSAAGTHPSGEPVGEIAIAGPAKTVPLLASIRLDPRAMVHASDGSLTVRLAPISLSVQPLLTFLNGSKDGCWSILARPGDRVGPEPRLRGSERDGERSCALLYALRGQGSATLRVHAEPEPGAITIEASSRLERVVYSHLNSYCDFEVRGHHRLALEFSPCPGVPVEVRRFDYPIGRPARFAFVQADRTFRVVEAWNGEKGPFRTLARGRLNPEQPVTITLYDQGRAIGRISLVDWSSQADTGLSPTAGWGAPVNAIEFSLSGDSPSSFASIFVTLAGTSVGRGWDCVGHNAGTYRNRISIAPVLEAEPSGEQLDK